jgi:hypothetical protein
MTNCGPPDRVAKQGVMQSIPNFHDGYVTGIRIRDQAAMVYLRSDEGADFELALERLEVLQMKDFGQGDVISIAVVTTDVPPPAVPTVLVSSRSALGGRRTVS